MLLATRRWTGAGLAVLLVASLTSCGLFEAAARSAPAVGDDLFRGARTVVDDAGRAAARAAQNRAAREELMAQVRTYLASDEWKATKAAAKITIKVSRQDPTCAMTIDSVFNDPADAAASFTALAREAESTEGGEGLQTDATAISDEASNASNDLDLAKLASFVELFKDAYCE